MNGSPAKGYSSAYSSSAAFDASPSRVNGGAGAPTMAHGDWGVWVERLAALERASMLQAEQTGHATREASRVAAELQSRFATARDTAAAVGELSKVVQASSATVERVAAEVAAMKKTPRSTLAA